jgi:hypothetical protein
MKLPPSYEEFIGQFGRIVAQGRLDEIGEGMVIYILHDEDPTTYRPARLGRVGRAFFCNLFHYKNIK